MNVQHDVEIAAPPERVFEILADPARVPEWRPSIAEIADVSGPMSEPGTTYVTRYKGRTPDSHGRVLESDPPRRQVQAGEGAVKYEARMSLEPAGAGTRLRFDLDVQLPGGPLGRVAERAFVRRKVQRETADEFGRLKALAESAA